MSRRQIRFDAADPVPVVARRFDVGGLLLKPTPRGSDGAMLFEGVPVREGILVYRQADGTERRELVTREAVIDSARTLARAPVTLEHPAEGFVDATNADSLAVGDVDGETVVEEDQLGGFARVKIAVRRQDALDAIDGGKSELSPGYEVTLDETAGEHEVFGRYDARQIGRRCNHLAIVDRGRGGTTVRLRTDSADAVQVGRVESTPAPSRRIDNEERHMRNLTLLLAALGMKQRYDTDEAAIDAAIPVAERLASEATARKDADDELETLKAENEKLKADLEEAKAKADEMAEEMAGLKKDMGEMKQAEQDRKDAAELADLRDLAGKVSVKHDGLDLPSLRLAIAKTRVDSVDGKTSAEFISGLIAAVRADAAKAPARSRWDWGKGDGDREDAADKDEFYTPHLDAADKARTVAGGTQ